MAVLNSVVAMLCGGTDTGGTIFCTQDGHTRWSPTPLQYPGNRSVHGALVHVHGDDALHNIKTHDSRI